MIKKIHIQGYKTLHDCEVELGNLTVLIGENASGKTNFLNAITAFIKRDLTSEGGAGRVLSQNVKDLRITVEYRVNHLYKAVWQPTPTDHNYHHWFWDETENQFRLGIPSQLHFDADIQPLLIYKHIRADTGAEIRRPQPVAPVIYLSEDGGNLINVLFRYFNDDAFKAEVKKILKYVVPDFETLIIDSPAGNFVNLTWKEKYLKRDLYASDLSDGTLKLLCLCAILCSNTIVAPPKLIAIDEPEALLHPCLFKLLAELIESKSKESQIIITTHSPEFLSYFTLDQILTVRRENGKSIFERPATKAHLKKMLENYETSIGELWLSGELGDTTVKVDAP